MTLSEICEQMCRSERRGAELMLQGHNVLAERKTGARDVVTEYDRRVQELLVAELRAALPDAHFFCEEMDEREKLDLEHVFIIDPIDGTMNFVRGFQHSGISVAYASRGELLAGAIYNPYLDEMFYAVKGEGAFLNGRPIHVSDESLAETVALFGTAPYRPDLADRTFALARRLYEVGLDVRREGTASLDLCSIAAGRSGLYVELDLSLWDFAAGAVIVREAGGVCCRADGTPLRLSPEKSSLAAGTPRAMADYLALEY